MAQLKISSVVIRFRSLILFLFALTLFAFAFQGSRGLYSPDEGYYVSIAQAMTKSGEYLIPRLHHEPWLDKPPLSIWGIAAGLKLLGQNEWGARAFHGLCFALTALMVFLLGRFMNGDREGLLGSTIYATMSIPFVAGNVVTPDTPLVLWTTISFFCFWKSVEPDARHVVLWKMLMCAAFGLGFLTKGPAALIPAGAMFLFLVIQGRAWKYFMTPWAVAGVVLFSILGLSWYMYVTHSLSGALGYFLDNQLIGRTVSDKYARNPGLKGALIYLPVVLGGALPWSFFWLKALHRTRKKVFKKTAWNNLRQDPPRLFLALWIAVPIFVLCLASSKLPFYALPVFPALALATARLFPKHNEKDVGSNRLGFSRRAIFLLGIWIILLIGTRWAAGFYPHKKDMRALYAKIEAYIPAEPYEIVAVDEHLEGLGFYSDAYVERVTTDQTPYPFFVLPEHLDAEISELVGADYAHLFICRRERLAEPLRVSLQKLGVQFREEVLPFKRYLFIVTAMKQAKDVVRLVALGDAGKGQGKSQNYDMGSALRRAYGETSFSDGILLLGDNLYCGPEDSGSLAAVAQREIENPFKDIIDLGVPFYAALGNHDNDHGLESFELQYPLFNMKGRRFYSQIFRGNLVEVFFLDSNTLNDESGGEQDPEQIRWLQGALEGSRARWKVVIMHHPLYSTAMKYPTDPDMIRLLEPLFREYGVSLVLQGHNHIYERLRPVHGIEYVTAGSGGTVRTADLNPNAPQRLAGNDQDLVFLLLEFDQNTCHLTAYDVLLNIVDEYSFTQAAQDEHKKLR